MSDTAKIRRCSLTCLIGIGLLLATLTCYWPVVHLGFLNYDDPEYVSANPIVLQGLTWPGIKGAFQTFHTCNWLPLTWLSYMCGCQFFGPGAGPQHAINLLLHAANVLLLFLMLKRATGATWRSAFVAAAFGWHPMHVESVAWIAERKDVLSGFFFLLAVWAYVRYAEVQSLKSKVQSRAAAGGGQNPGSRITHHASLYYATSLLFFTCGLLSKPMVVTLPFVLLLLDYWPLQRFSLPSLQHSISPLPRLILEKLPFFALSAADCAVTFWAQKSGEAVWSLRLLPLTLRLENAALATAAYVGKLFWPGQMAVLYPYPNSISLWEAAGAAMLLAGITLAALWQARRHPCLAVGWFWFVGMLVPVSGLVQVGAQSLADRYTYLPYIGLLIMLAWGLPALLATKWLRRGTAGLGLAAVVTLTGCWVGTQLQLRYWRDNVSLFEHAVRVTTDNEMAYNMLGVSLLQTQQVDQAIPWFQAAIDLHLRSQARFPYYSYHNLGQAYARQGKLDEAIGMFREAIKLQPGFAPAHYNLGQALRSKGDLDACAGELAIAARLAPGKAEVQNELAQVFLKTGRTNEAVRFFEAQAKAVPRDPLPHFILARLCTQLDRPEDVAAHLKEAIRLAPALLYLNQLAWIYATHPRAEVRNGAEAVRLAERACQLTHRKEGGFLDTLSAAYAEAGRFGEAIQTAEEARALASANQDQEGIEAATQKLELYRVGKPYREK